MIKIVVAVLGLVFFGTILRRVLSRERRASAYPDLPPRSRRMVLRMEKAQVVAFLLLLFLGVVLVMMGIDLLPRDFMRWLAFAMVGCAAAIPLLEIIKNVIHLKADVDDVHRMQHRNGS